MKFFIRDIMFVTVIVALVLGWWIDHRREEAEKAAVRQQFADESSKLRAELKTAAETTSHQDRIIAEQNRILKYGKTKPRHVRESQALVPSLSKT